MTAGQAPHIVLHVLGGLETRLTTEAADVRLRAIEPAEIEELTGARLIADLSECQVAAERLRERADVLSELLAQCRGVLEIAAQADRFLAVLIVRFIREEEVHPVLHDRTAEAQSPLVALVRRIRRWIERIFADQILVLIEDEGVALQAVRARLRDRRDDRARRLRVLRAVVLRDHAELLHGVLRERVAAAG